MFRSVTHDILKDNRLDVLINNAGVVTKLAVEDDDDKLSVWHETMAVNLHAPLQLMKLAHAHMKSNTTKRKGGVIINNTSIHGSRSVEYMTAYAASKAALDSLTRGLACEYAADGVRVNAIAPGVVPVERTAEAFSNPDVVDMWTPHLPVGRLGTIEDIAQATVVLATNEWLSGTVLTVDGGMMARANMPIRPRPPKPEQTSEEATSGNDDEEEPKASSSSSSVKFFELDDTTFEDDGDNVVGTKFFGGSTVKEELYVPEEEERALELQNVVSQKQEEVEYRRFEDAAAFDEVGGKVGGALQGAINKVLYDDGESLAVAWKEDPGLKWESPFSKAKGATSPLAELAASKSFYNKLDTAILSAKTIKSEDTSNVVEVRWDIGAVWPNLWESRVLLTGTSTLTMRDDGESVTLLKQVDRLDGSNPNDILGSLASQLPPRFWDVYHIGMTPSSEMDPRFGSPPSSSTALSTGKKGLLSGYELSYLPPRLVTEPSLVDTNGRDRRTAQALPNHGFTTAIKTMGPNKEVFTPVTPVEVSISKADGVEGGSLIKWTVPVPPEFASKHVLPLPVMDDDDEDDDEGGDSTIEDAPKRFESPYTPGRTNRPPPNPLQDLQCSYSLRPSRLVATLPYAGSPQDEEVTQLRRQLYSEAVERDGYTPKLDPETGRPMFFFWMNDAKACFTRKGGLGMAVYEWRADWSKSNAVGIELEC
ncbi:hypothetical protein ACHAXT_011538 [Thalassiosira profunda]